jgi:heme oxygenase
MAFDNPLDDFNLSVSANSCQDFDDVLPDTSSFKRVSFMSFSHSSSSLPSVPNAAQKNSDILVRLREQTRAEHAAIEQTLDILNSGMTLAAYRRILERFYGFYQPLERKLRGMAGVLAVGLELDRREKTALLGCDLSFLGRDPASLASSDQLPAVDGAPEALGCLYCLEGATLGGQIISRHLRKHLSITPANGGGFFHGYGEQTGDMWKKFKIELGAVAMNPQEQARVVEAARTTFLTLGRWCQKGLVP